MFMTSQTLQTASARAAALKDFQAGLSGDVIFPGDPDYDSARKVWNGMIDRYPAMIVRCAGRADVVAAVRFAQERDLPLAVRGGGHNSAGLAVCDGGLVIDLSQMKEITIDPLRLTARAEPGLTLGEFVQAIEGAGLLTTTGVISGTGMAGLTLGGGMGWLMGRYGLTIDNLLSVEIVTADGQIRTADENEHGDLLWAVRGGGGNFGVVTSFEYQLHPAEPLLAGMVVHPIERAQDVLRFYRDFTANAPDELTTYAAFARTPDGHPVIGLTVCYSGPRAEAERVIAPLRQFGPPLVDLIRPMSYYELITMLDAGAPDGRNYYEKANTLPTLTDEAIDQIVAIGTTRTSPFSQLMIQHVHGAAARVAPEATAFALRFDHYVTAFVAAWDHGPADTHIAWAREAFAATAPYATRGAYVNFLNDDGEDRVRAAYGANYARLARIKSKYDPSNIFRLNQNIKPISRVDA
jgi:FAD/FMN-containing dehydrogenase